MSRTVLLVDDEEDIRAVARMSLEALAGWTVLEAPDGPTGLERARAGDIDLIVLDMMMPGWDGATTLQRMREAGVDGVPVVFLTAKAQAGEIRRFEELGAAGVVAKPFDPMGLPAALSAAAGWE